MPSNHIETDTLYLVVKNQATLSESELKHLEDCTACQELVRMLVRQQQQAANGNKAESRVFTH
jgi:hypothetical protein